MSPGRYIFLIFLTSISIADAQLTYDGQLSAISSWSPQAERPFFLGVRYIPEIELERSIDTSSYLDFKVAVNLDAIWNEGSTDQNISMYRAWARYRRNQVELRVGLQKIEFGSAVILRPLQWFNQIDPRDPLQLTNGVYGILGRYYFLNNANIWIWALYGNQRQRGFDIFETNDRRPEYGGRVQLPVPRGEVALTYHHRVAMNESLAFLPLREEIPEHRFGVDGKWDLGVGLWFELAHQWKTIDLGPYNHSSLFTTGMDYTFGLGNGLGFVVEHLLVNGGSQPLMEGNYFNFTAATLTYPLTFFDNLSAIGYYNYEEQTLLGLINYEHKFKYFSLYTMAYYNPMQQVGIQQNELVYSFAGPGVRLMLVYNH